MPTLRTSPLLLTLCLAAACGDDAAPADEVVLSSRDHQLTLAADGTLTLARGSVVKAQIPRAGFVLGTVRELVDSASYDPWWLVFEDSVFKPDPPADLVWRPATEATVTARDARHATLSLGFGGALKATVEVEATDDDRFRLRWRPTGGVVAWMRLRASVDSTEEYYGLGEWPDTASHRGERRPMQMEPDLGIESANDENHVPVPLLVGTRGWGLFVGSRRPGMFDVAASAPDVVEVTYGTAAATEREGLDLMLIGADHPLDVTRAYYLETGQPNLPAPWALGPWIWRDENRDQAEVEADIATIRDLDLATTAIWIDRPYATKVNTFDFHAERFPDPAGMIAKIHGLGLRVALWSTPYLEAGAEPLLAEAEREGYFPPVTGTILNTWSAPIDLTNPAAFAFWQAQVRKYRDLGIEGFKLDYAEDVLLGFGGGRNVWSFFDGQDDRTMHYGYTRLYHQVYGETLPSETGFLLCRAGRWGDQVHASVIWPGDMDATFTRHRERFVPRGDTDEVVGVGGLPATVIQGMGLGPSGFPFYGADTGGYRHSPPDEELYIRWFQQTSLSTVMQVGDSSSQPPWLYTAENGRSLRTLDLYRASARLHLRLFPYLWTLAKRLHTDGRALQRPVGLAYPELGQHPDDQYLLGDDVLVAPVVDRGVRERAVVFPPGEWIDADTGERIAGPTTRTVAAPLERIPYYWRVGAPIPLLRPTIDTLSPTTEPGRVDSFATRAGPLYVRLARGGAATTRTLWDGTTLAARPDGLDLTPGTVFGADGAWLELAEPSPRAVLEDGLALPVVSSTVALGAAERGVVHTAERGGTLHVKLGPGAHRLTLAP